MMMTMRRRMRRGLTDAAVATTMRASSSRAVSKDEVCAFELI